MTHGRFTQVLVFVLLMLSGIAHAAQIEVAGKHVRTDGSIHDFEVVDGDALSPGDRFQIIISALKPTYYAIVYVSRDGNAAQIFPQTGRAGYIKSGSRQYVPGIDNYFTLDVNGGRELMFVVTAESDMSRLPTVLKKAGSVSSASQMYDYLRSQLPEVMKLEITNTGKKVSSTTDQISSSLAADFAAIYAKNPWPETINQDYNNERVRSGEDNTIPEAVRRRTAEVRAMMKRPAGAGGSSSLRTLQINPAAESVSSSGDIRRDAPVLVDDQRQREEDARRRKELLLEEERERQQKILAARQAQEQAEQEVLRLQRQRDEAQRQEAERIAEQQALEAQLEGKRRAYAAEAQRPEAEKPEVDKMALAQAETDAASKQQEIEMAEQQRLALERAEEQARLLAEQRANETAAREAEAEAEAAESNEQGFLGQMLAVFTGGDEQTAGSQAGQDEQREKAQATTVVETDSTDAVVLNEQPETQESFDNSIQQAPKEAVVVLQAPQRPAPRTFTAPAPVRTQPATAKETGNNLVSRDLYAEVASAIVSISTRNEPNASGFILDDKGHIVTAWNVINGVTEADVRFMGISGSARTYKARVIKYNKFHDLALLQLINPPEGIQPITVGPDSLPDAGAKVRVFGQKNGEIWATDDAVVTRISPHFTWFSKNNVIHRGEVLQVDLPQEGREVGSLVTSMDYQMLGMKSFTGSQTGRTYAVTVRMIKDFVTSK